jgi:hypothetical protein
MRKLPRRLWSAIRQVLALRGLLQWIGWWGTVWASLASAALAIGARLDGLAWPISVTLAVLVFAAIAAISVLWRVWFSPSNTAARIGRLPSGGLTWQPTRVPISIPSASQSDRPQLWAEGLARWDSFAVHNLWANRPKTQEDFELWRRAFQRWGDDVNAWMEQAGCQFLDVKEFAELGLVEGGHHSDDPALNHELIMLNMKRDRLKSLIARFRSMRTVKPIVSITVGSGTARPGDGRLLPSADIRLTNSGDPFTLVVFAKLLNVSPGFAGDGDWRYLPRRVSGGNDTSDFSIATIGAPVGEDWLVKLRGESFQTIRRWQGRADLQFDVEWTFQVDVDSVNKPLATVVTRVTLSEDRQRLDVVKLSETILPSVFGF